jgi:hypothetical protein
LLQISDWQGILATFAGSLIQVEAQGAGDVILPSVLARRAKNMTENFTIFRNLQLPIP